MAWGQYTGGQQMAQKPEYEYSWDGRVEEAENGEMYWVQVFIN